MGIVEGGLGAKTALLAFADGDLRSALVSATRSEQGQAEDVVRRALPGYAVEPLGEGSLSDWVYPPDDIAYAAVLPGAELVCDRRLVFDRPSALPAHLREVGAGRRIVLHGMHSGSDWLAFAVWEDGELVRSLSLSPDGGVRENIGEPYGFELPYWAGEHPVERTPGWPDSGPYALPFHPLDLGEEALRALFGFVLEGRREPDDIDAGDVPVHGFRVTDASGQERAAREATYARLLQQMGPPRRFRMRSDGSLPEVTPESP